MSKPMTKQSSSSGGGRQPKEVTGRTVLVCLLAFFGVVAGANAVMIRAATSTFGGVETESSYQAGRAFAREISAAHAQEARHWDVAARIKPAQGEKSEVEVVARDAAGAPLTNLTATAQLIHPTDRRFDHVVAMTERAPGQFAGTVEPAQGQWDLVIELGRDGERLFRSKNRITIDRITNR
jgi:nitrogen fixation protein FixH